MIGSPGRVMLVCCVTVLSVFGCTSAGSRSDDAYTFDAEQAPVQVDNPGLRQQKAKAKIADCPSSSEAALVEGGLPDITLPCLGGGRDVRLAGLRGTPMVLNFWAQTCGPCRTESPLFQQLHEAAGEEVAMVGIDWQDARPGYALAFADELGLTYPQIADPEGATRAPMRVTGLPLTLFVTAAGKVSHTEYGAIDSAGELASMVDRYLGVEVDLGSP
ncbi:MAG: TlpA family protein disulfide reductase [Actinomycetota bacterium]|nr:TlpA family protein disulfide reductase [Actinomycetota bacterium]